MTTTAQTVAPLVARLRETTATNRPFLGQPETAPIGEQIAALFRSAADLVEAAAESLGEEAFPLLIGTFEALGTSVDMVRPDAVDPLLAMLAAMTGQSPEDLIDSAKAAGHTMEADCPACAEAEGQGDDEPKTGLYL